MKCVVFGAGAIGGYVGGILAHHCYHNGGNGGSERSPSVVFIGRSSTQRHFSRGIDITSVNHGSIAVDEKSFVVVNCLTDDLRDHLATADVVVVAVKSTETPAVAAVLARHLTDDESSPSSSSPPTLIVSMQNGVRNAAILRESVPRQRAEVLACVVGFNVVWNGRHLHQSTDGVLWMPRSSCERAGEFVDRLNQTGVVGCCVLSPENFEKILHTKLLINLMNGVNAVSGIPVRAMIADRGYRTVLAACVEEGLDAVRRTKKEIGTMYYKGLPVWVLPHVFRLPDGVFRLVARSLLKMDAKALSSTLADVRAGKKETEIDFLNGEIVRMVAAGSSARQGTGCPVNQTIVALVKEGLEQESFPHKNSTDLLLACSVERPYSEASFYAATTAAMVGLVSTVFGMSFLRLAE